MSLSGETSFGGPAPAVPGRPGQALMFGGVMSSQRLRRMCLERVSKRRIPLRLYFGRPELSGDNAVGVALTGLERMVSHGSHS